MGKHLTLPALLLFLPLITARTAFNCLVTEGSQLPLVSKYVLPCVLDSSLSLFASCSLETNLTQVLEVVPRNVEGLCLSISASVLPRNAFSHFPELKVLGLHLRSTTLQPGALGGLEQLQRLTFIGRSMHLLHLSPEVFSNLSSLQDLTVSGSCLNRSLGVRLPPSLRRLAIRNSCLQNVGVLADIFPDLVLGSSSGDAWSLDMLDLSFNTGLNMSSPGALQGLQLRTLRLDHTKVEPAAVEGWGLQRLDALSAKRTATTELPVGVIAHFGLQELYLGTTQIGCIAAEALASCHSLMRLDLKSSRPIDLPSGFLAAMPRLQTLNLTINQMQLTMLCMNGTSVESGLWALDLSNNRLYTIPSDTFSCLPHLRELLLQQNQLFHLDGQVFQGLRRLETLDLSGNPLAALGKGWLASLPTLTTLNLLNIQMVLSSTLDFWGPKRLNNLKLRLLSGPPRTLSLPAGLASLELHADLGMKPWKLVTNVFPVLQTLTLKGWGLQLEAQNVSEIFPALHQLSLSGNSLEALCSQGSSCFFLWQLPRLEQLKVKGDGHNLRPCCITGLPSLRELKLQNLQSRARPRPVRLEELVGELPMLQVLQLQQTGLQTMSAAAFQGLRSLQVLVLDWENGLVLDASLQQHSPQMPQYMYFLTVTLACQCANAWMGPWVERSPRTYVYIARQVCQPEAGGRSKGLLFPFLWSHCPHTLELELFGGSCALLLLLLSLPFLQEARYWILYLQALFRAWFQGLRGHRNESRRFLYDVLVSHCRQDQGWVMQELLPTLEGYLPAGWGLRVCLPERDFEPGKDVADNVADSMVGSRITLCVLSPQALCTPRCRLELRLATSLLLAAPNLPVLLLVFLEPVSCHLLPRYHRLAKLLRRGDYHVWPREEKRKDDFWAWLGKRLEQPR